MAIVGAGLAGTLVAVHLLREATQPLDILLLDRSGDFGPGIAYSTGDDQHLLNQPAERMSAFGEAPGHFSAWAGSEPDAFLPRRLYGEYLRALLDDAERRRARGVALHRLVDEAEALEHQSDGVRVHLAGGRTLATDAAVLATGPLAGRVPAGLPDDPRVFGDPWAPGALAAPAGATVALIGTGLTAVDAALSLCAAGARVVAVSRHGELPFAHLPGLREPAPTPRSRPPGLDALVQMLRSHVDHMLAEGYDWRDVVDGIRPAVPELWQALPAEERRRFLRTFMRAWEVRRHRMAPDVATRVHVLREHGRLRVLAGEVAAVREAGHCLELTIGGESVTATRVIACTGPGADVRADPLPRCLIDQGHAAPDALGLGLRTAADGALLGPDARASPSLYTLGALRRGELYESTAAGEIRTQARDVADALRRSLGDRLRTQSLVSPPN